MAKKPMSASSATTMSTDLPAASTTTSPSGASSRRANCVARSTATPQAWPPASRRARIRIALALAHRAVRQQAPHPVDALDGVDEERVARRFHQAFMEAHVALVPLVGRGAGDAAGEHVPFGGAAWFQHLALQPEARLEQRGRLQRHATRPRMAA
jgi:hypothetical protein